MMATLSDYVSVRSRFARSANLERDSGRSEPFDGYIVTGRALDVIDRINGAALTGRSGGAWSLTGPYGSGKSSLALLLDAAFGPSKRVRSVALNLIATASPEAAEAVRRAHDRHGTRRKGFQRGLVTANREPVTHTLLRALHAAVVGTYGGIPSAREFRAAGLLKEALRNLETPDSWRNGAASSDVVGIARCLAERAPLLLVVDEFGKTLEAIRDGGDADPYVLQQLAEAGQGAGLPIFIVTLQHLSFDDYLIGAEAAKRREWAKVQGRFEDVAYLESGRQTRALIGSVFDIRHQALRERIRRRAKTYSRSLRDLGIADGTDAKVLASCYPLHPLVALVLPELCSRYGQHERTLFSFLAGLDPSSVASFLTAKPLSERGPLPSVSLDRVYDYFVEGGAASSVALAQSSRWTEIATRLRDIHGLSRRETRLAKTIALLNLVSTSGTIRASREVLSLAEPGAGDAVAELERRGIVTYRAFADEYRIWQGTDIDIRRLLDEAHERIQQNSLFEILSGMEAPPPVVAARHSAEHHVLRVFSRRYAEGGESVGSLDSFSPYDGEVLLVVGSKAPSLPAPGPGSKPVIAAVPKSLKELDRTAREVAAVAAVLDDPAVAGDPVARGELGERLAQARAEFDRAFGVAFRPDACRWTIRVEEFIKQELTANRGSAPLSEAADLAYWSTPVVRNEMLNRTELTSQGAKARRMLLEAMIERGAERDLGFEGYGPEVAMYRAFLKGNGLHRSKRGQQELDFREPTDTFLKPAWKVVRREFRRARAGRLNLGEIYGTLLSPPIGMKAGVIPVFLTAALLAYRDEIAIYEHGTFKPVLSADLSERMVRNPGHFEIKHFANTTGARGEVVAALAKRLRVGGTARRYRVANVVAVVGHLVSAVRRLDRFTLKTRHLSDASLAARDVLVAAVEPDELLFRALPAALGFPPIRAGAQRCRDANAYARSVALVLAELRDRADELLAELLDLLLKTSAETTRLAVSGQAAALDGQVLDPQVRSFVLTLANDAAETDHDWVRAIATVVAKKAPSEWADEDVVSFRRELEPRVKAFQRLVALHTENRADGGGGFDALRVTLTRSDGSEHVRLVGVDESERPEADRALDVALEHLSEITGSPHRAHKVLLALLGERLLPERAEHDDVTPRVHRRVTSG
ncbi:MAG: hypothetical protein F4130_06805 [Acidobacteria bacterium]|nr:hypothetical protein [Acidobacteriota bacterium]